MYHRRVAIAMSVLVFGILAAWFWLSNAEPRTVHTGQDATAAVVIHAQYTQGTASYWGFLPLMSPCTSVSSGVSSTASYPPYLTFLFSTIEPTEVCDTLNEEPKEFFISYGMQQDTPPVVEILTINGVNTPFTITTE
jgi:hypothetical protein